MLLNVYRLHVLFSLAHAPDSSRTFFHFLSAPTQGAGSLFALEDHPRVTFMAEKCFYEESFLVDAIKKPELFHGFMYRAIYGSKLSRQ